MKCCFTCVHGSHMCMAMVVQGRGQRRNGLLPPKKELKRARGGQPKLLQLARTARPSPAKRPSRSRLACRMLLVSATVACETSSMTSLDGGRYNDVHFIRLDGVWPSDIPPLRGAGDGGFEQLLLQALVLYRLADA